MRILLVEDDPEVGALVKETLEAEPYAVDWAQDGEAALRLALRNLLENALKFTPAGEARLWCGL